MIPRRRWWNLVGLAATLPGVAAEPAPITTAAPSPPTIVAPPFVVTATRASSAATDLAVQVDEFDAAFFRDTPALTLDDALRASAAFSLFRRTGSLGANPTAQGVSLRGLGPSGASRSLVLFDGVPLNDPFGGWVAWSKLPQLGLQRAEIVRGGGSGVWGNAALGGTIQLFRPAALTAGGRIAAEFGSWQTRRVEAFATTAGHGGAAWSVGARWFETGGYPQFPPAQRGTIDRRLDSRHTLGHAEFVAPLRSGLQLGGGMRYFDEERGNGTPFQRNDSREFAAHVRLAGEVRPGLALEAHAYAQRQHFASGFSAVDDGRENETPSLDQFDVPATAWGGALLATWGGGSADHATTTLGTDARFVSGETREDFFFSAPDFLRRRFAGGEQLAIGSFVAHQRRIAPDLDLQVAARLDHWRNRGGHRREIVRATGAILRDDRFADADGTELSPSLGATWRFAPAWRLRAAAYRAFRVPTLNELHRPFRVGNVATEANPLLRRETVNGVEAGVEVARGPWRVRGGAFSNHLRNGVANVTLSSTPALTQRQRLNLESIRVQGIEAGVGWRSGEALDLAFDYLLADARVRRASVASALVGRRLAQVPRHVATLSVGWRPAGRWRMQAGVRAASAQFEDDENSLALAGFVTADLAAYWTIGAGHTLSLAIENLFATRVETGRATSGVVNLGPPRFARVGWQAGW